MLNDFDRWFRKNESKLNDMRLTVDITGPASPADKRSIRADIDTPKYLGRVTLWDSGECQTEAIDIATEKTVFHTYAVIQSPQDLDRLLKTFISELTSPSPPTT